MSRMIITEDIKDKIGRECANCHSTLNLVYHHIVPLSMGGKDSVSNMVCLCDMCHDKIHYGKTGAISHSEAVCNGIKAAQDKGVHFGRKSANHEKIMQAIAENSTQFNPCSHTTESEIMDMLGIRPTLYYKCKKLLLKDMQCDIWAHSFEKPRYHMKHPEYAHLVKRIRG